MVKDAGFIYSLVVDRAMSLSSVQDSHDVNLALIEEVIAESAGQKERRNANIMVSIKDQGFSGQRTRQRAE